MSEHVLRVSKITFEEAQGKRKVLDFRLNDVAFQQGDLLTLEEFDFEAETATGRTTRAKAGSIFRGGKRLVPVLFETTAESYCIVAILPIDE